MKITAVSLSVVNIMSKGFGRFQRTFLQKGSLVGVQGAKPPCKKKGCSEEHPFFLYSSADLVLAHGCLDAEKAVVLGYPLGAAGSARLDKGSACGHGDVGNGGVFGLT